MGEIALLVVILLRALVPFTILRWRLAGVLLAIVADATDRRRHEPLKPHAWVVQFCQSIDLLLIGR